MAWGLSARIARKWGPLRSYMAARARYSRVISAEVVTPVVIASWSCDTVFSKTVNGGMVGCDGRVQFAICARLRGDRPRISGSPRSFLATSVTLAISDPEGGIFGCLPE